MSFALLAGALLLVGCGQSDDLTALAVEHPQWVTDGSETDGSEFEGRLLRLDTECSDVSETSIAVGAGVDGMPLVTVWGHPRVGRCRSEVVVTVPSGTTRIEDAATGMVVDLPVS